MIAVTGATGNVGSKISDQLLTEGHDITVIGRDAERLKPFADRGATAHVGDLGDPEFATRAFTGADAVFAIIPPNVQAEDYIAYMDRMGESIAAGIRNAGVKKVVTLSSQGAELEEGTGPVVGLRHQEERFNLMEGVDVVHLRPSYFMENFLWNLDMIKGQGINGGTLEPKRKFHVIASRDIAKVAAEYLKQPDFQGNNVRDLLGAGAISPEEITRLIGKEIGNDKLPYIQFPYEDAERSMIDMGLSPSVASNYNELNRAMNEGIVESHEKELTDENRTGTTFEEFSRIFGEMMRKDQEG